MTEAQVAAPASWRPSSPRERFAAGFGMWVFLASELLFFSGLFLLYAVVRFAAPEEFFAAARETSIALGTTNTAILLTSSFAMALADEAAEFRRARLARLCLAMTAAFGAAFLLVKGYEYYDDIRRGLLPGYGFALETRTAHLFFALYWTATALHGVHVTVGALLIAGLAVASRSRPEMLEERATVHVLALYWHFVDAIWIVLYPLLYLVGRSG